MSQKYEKVILGVGITLAIAAGAWVYYDSSTFEDQYTPARSLPDKNTPVAGIEKADALLQILDADTHLIPTPDIGKQKFAIFHSPVLYNKAGTTTVFDIYDSEPVHKDIPNTWFVENNLLDAFKMSNAPDIDSDNDGFTNYEEFLAKTKPNDATNFPNLLSKVVGKEIKASRFNLAYTNEAFDDVPAEIRAFPPTSNASVLPIWKEQVKPGSEFGKNDQNGRFKLVRFDKVSKDGMDETIAIVEDLKPEKQGQTYSIPYGRRKAVTIVDLSAVLTVEGGPKKGEDFTIVEGRNMVIPGDPTNTVYFAEKIDLKAKTLTLKKKDGGDPIIITF